MMFVAYLPIIKHDVLEINHLMIFIDFPSYKPTFTSGISEYPLEFQRFQRPAVSVVDPQVMDCLFQKMTDGPW